MPSDSSIPSPFRGSFCHSTRTPCQPEHPSLLSMDFAKCHAFTDPQVFSKSSRTGGVSRVHIDISSMVFERGQQHLFMYSSDVRNVPHACELDSCRLAINAL